MNYYLEQSTYFLIFVVMGVMAWVLTPVVTSLFSNASDLYAQSKLQTIRGEIFFAEKKRGSFQHACYTGSIGLLVQDLIQEYSKKVVCRTNINYSQMIVYAELRSGAYYCIDSIGNSSSFLREPKDTFNCTGVRSQSY